MSTSFSDAEERIESINDSVRRRFAEKHKDWPEAILTTIPVSFWPWHKRSKTIQMIVQHEFASLSVVIPRKQGNWFLVTAIRINGKDQITITSNPLLDGRAGVPAFVFGPVATDRKNHPIALHFDTCMPGQSIEIDIYNMRRLWKSTFSCSFIGNHRKAA